MGAAPPDDGNDQKRLPTPEKSSKKLRCGNIDCDGTCEKTCKKVQKKLIKNLVGTKIFVSLHQQNKPNKFFKPLNFRIMKTTVKNQIAKVDIAKVNAKSAQAAEIAKTAKTQKGTKRPKVTKVEAPAPAPVAEKKIVIKAGETVPDKIAKLETMLIGMKQELQDAADKHDSAKSPNTKKKYAKLCETILDEMKPFKEELDQLRAITGKEVTAGSAPMGEKVRLADLPIGSCYKYRETGAIYKLLKVDGAMIEAAESNGKTFTAKAANYKVFQVEEGVQA